MTATHRSRTTTTPLSSRTASPRPLTRTAKTGLPPGLGDVLFADADQALCGTIDRTWRTSRSDDPTWAAEVVHGLRPGQRAVAAFSFEDDQPAVAHRLGTSLCIAGGIRALAEHLAPGAREPRHLVLRQPDPERYAEAVRQALVAIDTGSVEKVVLGRSAEVLCDPPLPPTELLHHLAGGQDGSPAGRYLHAVPVGEDALLLGASPELLVRRTGTLVEAQPLAGSVPRSSDPVVDEERRTALLTSTKDLAEHAHVVTDLVARLREVCVSVQAEGPEVVGTDTLWHLGTRITARLEESQAASWHALALARLVHPTPAVGGVPGPEARRLITTLEPRPRGWFAGAVGWVDAAGDGEFALTLRSGVLEGESLRVWAGAGIVAGSVPADEVTETGAKLATMTRAVGL